MSEENGDTRPRGVTVGLVEDGSGKPHIAISIVGHPAVVMSIDYAGILLDQIAGLLDEVGYFKDEGEPKAVPVRSNKGVKH